ncbi:hypothetical protein CE557_344 [Cardinium endosymbiont of Sogatella furcifera]|uniref:hypothetical protein n=1 Tax=Cardinium endosymbiont of Sogatella furcifera TaxID=650378 RepID=UPI000E0D1E9E|nr:hypothetical protein [Cardinium endosymbiont of Sogatella furcifera]AXI24169.1 hypothetical protein CE557_344 [Cardinium endosymbiont of Sogatella furcifera]
MKIKIALLGLFFANSITIDPIYADQYDFQLEADEVDGAPLVEQDVLEAKEAAKDATKTEQLIKVGATVTMGPSVIYQDEAFSTENSLAAQLKFSADVPKAWCNKEAKVSIGTSWKGKEFKIKNAAVIIGKMVTMGYTSTIFGYEKADSSLLISPSVTVLQLKHAYSFDCFRFGYAIERPLALKVGCFDKNHSEEQDNDEKEKSRVNKWDKLDDKKRPVQTKDRIPAFGINVGIVTDQWNIGLSGLGRLTDYTHGTHEKDAKTHYFLSGGGHLGIQYEIPKQFTFSMQGAYVYGLGDYLPGPAAIQDDKEREEMCAAYYIDKEKDTLYAISALGGGLMLAYCATPKWTLSIRGSYLSTLENEEEHKPAQAFKYQYNIVPTVAYEVNKYFTLSGGYSLIKEGRQKEGKDKDMEHKWSGCIKFSL